MLIGNRQRPQMDRKTSIMRITVEVDGDLTADQESDVAMAVEDRRFSPGNHRRNEGKGGGKPSFSTSSFLGNCGFCKRSLTPGRDIYMYKGNAAFCSVECREQQMEHDEGKT